MLVISIGFLLVVSLVMSAVVAALGRFVTHLLPGPEFLLQLLDGTVSFAIFTVFFAMMLKTLPHAHIAWRDVWIGAVATTLLFTVGKFVIGVYLGKTGIASAYGAASSLAVMLLWVYYSALIFFFGAEFTYVYANEYGSHIRAAGRNEAMERTSNRTSER
jgi:membrane protein